MQLNRYVALTGIATVAVAGVVTGLVLAMRDDGSEASSAESQPTIADTSTATNVPSPTQPPASPTAVPATATAIPPTAAPVARATTVAPAEQPAAAPTEPPPPPPTAVPPTTAPPAATATVGIDLPAYGGGSGGGPTFGGGFGGPAY